jgi:hypothetical protein
MAWSPEVILVGIQFLSLALERGEPWVSYTLKYKLPRVNNCTDHVKKQAVLQMSTQMPSLHCEKISFNWLQLTCGVVTPQLGYYRDLFQNDFFCTVTVHDAQSLCIKV